MSEAVSFAVEVLQMPRQAAGVLGVYPLPLSTRRTWALEIQTILESRRTAPCSIRVGTALPTSRRPPC